MSVKIEIDKDFLIQKYEIEKLSTYKISKLINIGQHIVVKRLKEYGIRIRSLSEARRIFIPEKIFKCTDCGKEVSVNKTKCRHCAHLQKNRKTPKKEYFCIECGTQVSRKSARRCPKCQSKYANKKQNEKRIYKIYNCIDCGIQVKTNYTKRCHDCDIKLRRNNLMPKPRCIDCGKLIRHRDSKRCYKCAHTGKNNNFYKHGRCNLGYAPGFTITLKKKIRKRDNYTCQVCGKTQKEELKDLKSSLVVHHVDYDKSNHAETNLASVCHSCHGKTNLNREAWIAYFTKLLKG